MSSRVLIVASLFLLISTEGLSQTFWERTRGPYGGSAYVTTQLFDQKILAGTENGLYSSEDNGLTWSIFGLESRLVSALAQAPLGDIFAGTSGGVWTTSDQGETWRLSGLSGIHIFGVISNSQGELFAGTWSNGLHRSTNNGFNWTRLTNGLNLSTVSSMAVNSLDDTFVGGSSLFRSTDGGESWTELSSFPSGTSAWIDIDSSNTLVVGAYPGVFESTDNGETWVSLGLSNLGINTVVLDSAHRIFAGTSGGEIYVSTDSVGEWTRVDSLEHSVDHLGRGSDGVLFAATPTTGLFRSDDDGSTWGVSNDGIAISNVRSLYNGIEGTLFAGTDDIGIQFSTDGGTHWNETNMLPIRVNTFALDSSDNLLAGATGFESGTGGVYLSSDGGINWIRVFEKQYAVNGIAVNALGHIFACTMNEGVYRSTDGGLSWVQINNGLTSLHCYSIAATDAGSILAGTQLGLFKSTNSGDSWLYRYVVPSYINVIARSDQGDLLAGVGYKEGLSGAFRSTNDGENWSRMGLLDFAVTSLIESKGMLFAMAFSLGLGTGIYRSTDQGGSWELINSGLTNLSFTTLSLDSSGYLYVSTLGSGVFRSSGPITSVDDFGNTHPQDYVLEQNYPNPFNPTTQIRFQITGYEFVSIRIYDILGRHIATLMNEKKEAGFHDVTWDATGQPSGVYFYRLQAGDFVETRKLVLLR